LKQEKTHVLVKNSRASPEIDVALLQVVVGVVGSGSSKQVVVFFFYIVVVVVVVGHFEKHALQRRLATPLVAFGAQI
jgi:hypothetical protein